MNRGFLALIPEYKSSFTESLKKLSDKELLRIMHLREKILGKRLNSGSATKWLEAKQAVADVYLARPDLFDDGKLAEHYKDNLPGLTMCFIGRKDGGVVPLGQIEY